MPQPSPMKLALNVAPIQYPKTVITAYSEAFKSTDEIPTIRERYRGTHFVRRYAENQVLVVPLRAESAALGTPVKVDLSESPYLVAALVRESLINYLFSIGRQITAVNPITFLDTKTDLLRQATKDKSKGDLILVRPAIAIDVRVFEFERGAPFVGSALTVRVVKNIEATCSALLGKGMNLSGLYVGPKLPDRDSRISPRLISFGRVSRVEGQNLILEDARPGQEQISVCDAFLDASPEAIRRVLELGFGTEAAAIRTRLFHLENELNSGPKKWQRVEQVNNFLQTLSLELLPAIQFKFEPLVSKLPPVETCPKPIYVFDPSGAQTKTWHDGGLQEFGPYTRQLFTPSRPRICVICQEQVKGRVEQFLQKFLRGIPTIQKGRVAFANGLIGKYRLENCTTAFFLTESSSAESYKKAAMQAIQKSTNENFRWDLALVQVEEKFKTLLGDSSPYFVTKGLFLTQQVPIQDFRTEITGIRDFQLQFILNNMALATYAKMGGIPWLLKANPTIAHELVFGLGSAHLRGGRFGGAKRLVGITTVFSGDGKYRVSNISKTAEMQDYGAALLDSLRETVSRIKTEMNWQANDHVRLVFHAFKPIRNIEADAVKTAMSELGDFDLDYAFLHVAERHPFLLFDHSQKGIFDYETKQSKGILAPTRGLFMHLSPRETLLTLVGPSEVKTSNQGIPAPALLRLHPSSTFSDMTYLTRQLFLFACHSWRSFFPSELPVTIKYSDLIARLLGNLGMLSNWNPEVLVGRIANTRWFL
jgi:Piwi domain